MASRGNRHYTNCIGTLPFPITQIERNLGVTDCSWLRRTSLRSRCRHHRRSVMVYTALSADTGTDRCRHDMLYTVTTRHTNAEEMLVIRLITHIH